ncbi:hypothetical protein E2320_017362 [Naja naja]|nr:hypothetical protein E2320_017362 [Naja naja]
MSALNSFVPFDASTETWESHIERFDCFLEANNLVDLSGSRLLAKPDLMLQSTLDEACAVELSNQSTVEIHGVSSPVLGRKTLAVHQEEATEEDVDLPGDDDIHRLKTESGNNWQSTKTAQAQSCIGS